MLKIADEHLQLLINSAQTGRNIRAAHWKHMRSIDKTWARMQYRNDIKARKGKYHTCDSINYLRRILRCKPNA